MRSSRAAMMLAFDVMALAVLAPGGMARAANCAGVPITIGTVEPPFIGGPAIAHSQSWEQKTGGRANVVTFPFNELYASYAAAMAPGRHAFDVILYAPAWQADLVPFLSVMPAEIAKGADWDDIAPVYRDRMMVWNGKVIAQTIDGDVHAGTYRQDLLESPKEQAAFKARYGYPLAPPTSWQQYYDIAEFFTRPEDGLWGTAEAFARGGQQFWFFFSHAAAYTNHPDNKGAMFFDPMTMDAQIANPGWLRALEDYIKSAKLAPPGARGWSSFDIRTAFAGGRVAMALDWADTGTIAVDPKQSRVAGKVGFFVLPGSDQIWNHKSRTWDKLPRVLASPFMAFGGWVASVPAASKVQECAWGYIAWYASPQTSLRDVTTGGTGIDPYRLSHFEDLAAWTAGGTFSEREAKSYLNVQRTSIEHPNVALDMRIPGSFQYAEALELELTKALAGEVTPWQALDTAAKERDRLTDKLGRKRQLAAYRASMGLPPT